LLQVMVMVKVGPSILNADFAHLAEEIGKVKNADFIHVDVMDGHYVPNLSMGVPVVKALRKVTDLPIEVHLMVSNPDRFIKPFAEAGANGAIFHVETVANPLQTIKLMQVNDLVKGISANARVDIEKLFPFLADVDLAQVMTVEAGFGGQAFNVNAVYKIQQLARYLKEKKIACDVEVDGGIDLETGLRCLKAGANVLVAGTTVFASANPAEAVEQLKALKP